MSTRANVATEAPRGFDISRVSIWMAGVWVGAAVYAVALSVESLRLYNEFELTFDLAIYDQLLWLLANGHEPFSTVVSRPMLADHFTPGLVLFTPLYWLGLGIPGILVAQAIGLALTAPALFALARAAGASPALASIPALLWLVCPWTAAVNFHDFRPSNFAPVLLVVSVLAAIQGRHGLLAASTILALSLKEDVALTYFVLGMLLIARGRRRVGGVLAFGSVVWFVVASRVIQSLGGSYDVFAERFAGERGDSAADAFGWMVRHPLGTLGDIAGQSGVGLLLLVLSTAGLALLAPSWMLLAAPTALHNALSAHEPQHTLIRHYHLMTLAGLFVAAAIGAARVGSLGRRWQLAVTVGVATAIGVGILGGGFVRTHRYVDLDNASTQQALARIPAGVPVAATPRLLPHLSQRRAIYTFPEPFVPLNWGSPLTSEQMARRAGNVRFVAYLEGDELKRFYPGDIADVRALLSRQGFEVVARAGSVEILERRAR